MTAKTRFSVALDDHVYAELATMAEKHRVSMAWLVRYAVGEFFVDIARRTGSSLCS